MADADAVRGAQDAGPVEALFTMYEHGAALGLVQNTEEAGEHTRRRGGSVGEGQVFELHAGLLTPRTLLAKPAAAERMACAAAGTDDGAQAVFGPDVLQVADSRLAAAHENAGLDDVEMCQAVVAGTDEAGNPEAPLVRVGETGADAGRQTGGLLACGV